MTDAKIKIIRRFAVWTFLKITAAVAVVFLLVRTVTPELINAHDDTLGVLGLLSAISAPVIAGWAAVSIFMATRRFIGEMETKQ